MHPKKHPTITAFLVKDGDAFLNASTPHSKSCMIQNLLDMHSVVLSSLYYPVQNRPSTFSSTNVAWQDHSVCHYTVNVKSNESNIVFISLMFSLILSYTVNVECNLVFIPLMLSLILSLYR